MSGKIQCSFARIEKKYMLTPPQYRQILRGIGPYVRSDAYANYTICNVYYDTDDFQLIRASLEKPVYKEKLRMRSYGVPGDGDKVFVELKKKFDGIVYKRRVVLPVEEAVRYVHDGRKPREDSQIFREIDFFLHRCRPSPKVFIAYDREAYAGIDLPDLRITFDTGLRWRDTGLDLRCGSQGRPLLGNDQILMELKIPGAAPLWLARLLSQAEAFPTSFSKYGTWYKQKISGCYAPGTIHKEEHICA